VPAVGEPASGSNLAALRTRAARDGDDWVLSGQKVWTTLARVAEGRPADPHPPEHAGTTMFQSQVV
jgi:alkylation response protein AidB-like acyl-CoA dehydrogenase